MRGWLGSKKSAGFQNSVNPPPRVSQPLNRPAELHRWIEFYTEFNRAGLSGFPAGQMVHLETVPADQKPLIRTFLPSGSVPDRYAASFEKRLRLLGQDVARTGEAITGERVLLVDIRERTGRRPNEIPNSLEIPQAVVWLGLDYFVHIRSDSIRKTLQHCDRLLAVSEQFADDLSRLTALAIICDQLSGIPHELPPLSLPYDLQYFGTGLFELSTDEVIIDAGAANGDSLVKFRQYQPKFARYHAFEPDPILGQALQEFVTREYPNGEAVAAGTPLAERSGPTGMMFIPGSGNTRADPNSPDLLVASSIDDYLTGQRATIIKMDVEGAEPALLKGAAHTVRTFKPKLLISAYHEVEHLFEIPDLISSMRPDYRFYLRNHAWAGENDSWPGSFFCETVLYAI